MKVNLSKKATSTTLVRNTFSYWRIPKKIILRNDFSSKLALFLEDEVYDVESWKEDITSDLIESISGQFYGVLKQNGQVLVGAVIEGEFGDSNPVTLSQEAFLKIIEDWVQLKEKLLPDKIIVRATKNKAWINSETYSDPEKAVIVLTQKEKEYEIIQGGKESSLYFLALLLGKDSMIKKFNKKIQRVLKQKKDGFFGYDSLCTIKACDERAWVSFDNPFKERGPEFKTTKQKLLKLVEQWNELIKEKPSHVVIKKNGDVISFEVPPEIQV